MTRAHLSPSVIAAWFLIWAGPIFGQTTGDSTSFETSVIFEDEIDTKLKAQVEQRVAVSGTVTEEDMRAFLKERYRNLSKRGGFTHYDSPTNIFVYVFGSRERANDGGWGWMGAVIKEASDEGVSIQVRTDQIEDYNEGPETRLELEEDERKEIFKAIVRAEDRAREDARDQYPNDSDQRVELRRELEDKYRAEVRKKYDVNKAVQDSITSEGLEKMWPFPEP
jgi:hypothetical protein